MSTQTPLSSSTESIPKEIASNLKSLPSDQSQEPDQRPKVRDDGTFENVGDVRHYKPMPEYEGLHRWDPEFEWSELEEKKVLRKVRSFPCRKVLGYD